MRVLPVFFVATFACSACTPKDEGAKPTPSASATASASPPAVSPPVASVANEVAKPRHSGPAKPYAKVDPVVEFSTPKAVAPGAKEPTESPTSVGLPKVDFGEKGPIVVKGYPVPLALGMRDYANRVGYSKDGSKVIACGDMAPVSAKGTELGNVCFVNDGSATKRYTVDEGRDGFVVGPEFAAVLRELAEGHVQELQQRRQPAGDLQLVPPSLATTWPYARDITLEVGSGGEGASALKVGGRVGSEEPVYSTTLSVKAPHPSMTYGGAWNAILGSPKEGELAFIGHFFCMEWCNDIVVARLTHGELASLVYNDTGFRHHQKKDFAGSRDLFLKATWANPRAPLPPYNLACAYARLNDKDNAGRALRLAIAVDGERVKARAKKDADFATVAKDEWFKKLTD